MYTVYEVAKEANVTVKTLYYYHKIELLIPKEVNEEGVRYYDEENLERLQEILFYKELNFSLKEIKAFLDNKVSREDILIEQKLLLQKKIDMLSQHIKTIDKTLNKNKYHHHNNKNLFDGFSREEFDIMIKKKQAYLLEKYGINVSFDPKSMKEEEIRDFIKFNKKFEKDMISFLQNKKAPNDKEVIKTAKNHFLEHKKYFNEIDIDSYNKRYEIAIIDDYFRHHMEETQIGITYFLRQVGLFLKEEMEKEEE